MRVMVMIKATPQSEAGAMPSEDLLVAMGNYNDALLVDIYTGEVVDVIHDFFW